MVVGVSTSMIYDLVINPTFVDKMKGAVSYEKYFLVIGAKVIQEYWNLRVLPEIKLKQLTDQIN